MDRYSRRRVREAGVVFSRPSTASELHLMEEIEELREKHGVRITAAVALVAERHGLPDATLGLEHFRWLLSTAGADLFARPG